VSGEVASVVSRYEQQLSSLRAEHEAELVRLRADLSSASESRVSGEVASVVSRYEQQLSSLRAEHEVELVRLRADLSSASESRVSADQVVKLIEEYYGIGVRKVDAFSSAKARAHSDVAYKVYCLHDFRDAMLQWFHDIMN
jgi:hypothetical protein